MLREGRRTDRWSQFVDDEDDLYETLNHSLHQNGLGDTPLDDQMEFGPFGPGFIDDIRAEDGIPAHGVYDFGRFHFPIYHAISPRLTCMTQT